MGERLHNFSAGPGVLPESVLIEVRDELLCFRDAGASIMEISHRSPQYTSVVESARELLRELLGLDPSWHILFLQGGASMQFYQVPLNFLTPGNAAAYVNTGAWSKKAIAEAQRIGHTEVVASSADTGFDQIPERSTWKSIADPAYTHITTNNTIFGTQFASDPEVEGVVVADMSSDFLSRPVRLDDYGLIYAGAQKNLGPAGVTVVLIKDDFLQRRNADLPTMLDYGTHAAKLFNTPPVFAVYVVEKVLQWIKAGGGLDEMARRNEQKAGLIYSVIDASDFYSGVAKHGHRSLMNITFRLPAPEQETAFVDRAKAEGLVALKGHRSAGGIRASTYNACPTDSVRALAAFMTEFERTAG